MIDFNSKQVTTESVVVAVRGQLNDITRVYFFDYLEDEIANGSRNVIVDCGGLGFLSSAGMAALLSARKRAQTQGGRIYLTHLNSIVATALSLTKLGSLLAIFPTNEDALETVRLSDCSSGG